MSDEYEGNPAVEKLLAEFQKNVDYFRREFNITYIELLGILEVLKQHYWDEIKRNEEEGDEI